MIKPTYTLLSVLVLASVVLTSCGGAGVASGSIKVAVLAPLSGPVPTFGVSTRDGALLAIEEWNAKGGVLGQKIEPVVADSQCTADPAVNAANKVIDQDGVHYIVGEVCSKASIPISEIAESKGVKQSQRRYRGYLLQSSGWRSNHRQRLPHPGRPSPNRHHPS